MESVPEYQTGIKCHKYSVHPSREDSCFVIKKTTIYKVKRDYKEDPRLYTEALNQKDKFVLMFSKYCAKLSQTSRLLKESEEDKVDPQNNVLLFSVIVAKNGSNLDLALFDGYNIYKFERENHCLYFIWHFFPLRAHNFGMTLSQRTLEVFKDHNDMARTGFDSKELSVLMNAGMAGLKMEYLSTLKKVSGMDVRLFDELQMVSFRNGPQ